MSSLDELFRSHGVHLRPLRTALALLSTGWQSLDELIRRSGAPRRSVEELLTALGDDLERDGDRTRLRPGTTPFTVSEPSTEDRETLLTTIIRQVKHVPPPLPALDHVQATPDTVLRRALWLHEQYDLDQAELLFLGDHDLTSLAVHAVCPGARLTVVDLDERVLAYLDEQSGRAIRTLHADLRLGLPPGLAADLVFSDPPYTPEGMALFAARGVEALADPPLGRLLLAYGYSPRHPALGAQVQQELLGLGLTFEAILPDFHEYLGAQAIGSRADLYVCQPTAKVKKQKAGKQAIYTHGPQSVESSSAEVAGLDEIAGATGLTVKTQRADWSTVINGKPGTALAINLAGDPGPWLARVLLATNAERVAVLVPNSHADLANAEAQQSLRALLDGKFSLKLMRSAPDNRHAVVVADAVESPSLLLTRAHARLGNLPPEVRPADTALHPHRLIDLPRHRIAELLQD